MIWKFRLITLIPVVMSLLGSVSCFAIGTYAELSVLARVLQGHFTHTNSTLLIGKVVGGIDYYLIGIALLIFGYCIYEVVSDIDPRSPAAASGLQKGDIIIGVNRQRINSMGELTKVLKNKPEVLALNIQRGDSSLYLVIR